MRRIWITIILALLCSRSSFGQSGLCNSGVPFFLVDLTGQPNGSFISSPISRNQFCCGSGNPDRCIEFEVTLDATAVGINFEIYSGAQPPGALYYQINCGPLVPVGQQICLSGIGPHTITFCKPGNNKNQYRITSIKGYSNEIDVFTVEDCSVDLHVSDLVDSTIVWQDITGGGYYENFLDCTSGCPDVTFTTEIGFPAFIDFEVCGKIYSSVCQSIMHTVCDTIRVNIEPKVKVSLTPDSALICQTDSGRMITALILPHKSSYVISWMSGSDGTGSVLSNDTFYFVQLPGNYSIVVRDTSLAMCSSDTANFTLTEIPSPPVEIFTGDVSICRDDTATLSVSGAITYSWNSSSSLSCDSCASFMISPDTTTIYYVTGADSFGCEANDTVTVNVIIPKDTSFSFSICDGDSVTIGGSVYNSAGTYYDTLAASNGCDSIITSTIQIRNKYSIFVDTVICSGSSLTIGNSVYSSPGTYFDTLPASNGCDSMIETHLAVHPVGACGNPDLNFCPQRIIFVLDESGSIVGQGSGTTNINTQVRNAASGLVSSLAGSGSEVAVVEFNSDARRAIIGGVTGYRTVDATFITQFNSYIAQDANGTTSAANYDPEDYSCTVPQSCYTNWEDAFEEIQNINTTLGLANLVIFFTDGQPTAFNNTWGGVTVGTGAATIAQALSEANGAANAVQMQGSHIFVIGLPNPTLPEANVQQISGLERFPDQQNSFLKADYTISSSAQLVNSVVGISVMLCQADLRLDVSISRPVVCAGSNVIFTIIISNDGSGIASGVQVKDYLPNGYSYISDNGGSATSISAGTITWDVGNLYSGQSDTLLISAGVNASGNYKNVAEITASDQADGDSTPGNDDGDQSEDDEDAVTVTYLNCDDGDICTGDVCTTGSCSHSYIPAACSINGDNDICLGETTQFNATGGVAYVWSGPNGFASNNATTGVVSDAGIYSVTVTNGNGCTNTCSITLYVRSLPVCGIVGNNIICQDEVTSFSASGGSLYSWSGPGGYTANSMSISAISVAGNYSVTTTNSYGCSNNCSTSLTELTTAITFINDSVCFGENYVMGGSSYSTPGIYYDTLVCTNGCDSILSLNLTVLPETYGPFNAVFCSGDSVVVGSSVYKNSGIYYDTLLSQFGCDSIIITDIQVLNHSQVANNRTICSGESVTVLSSTYAISGTYYDTTIAANGCDSVIQTTLVVLPVSSTVIDTAICFNESITVGTSSYTAAGTYYDILTSANGCDSTIQTNLQVLPVQVITIDTSICFGDAYTVGSSNYTSSGTYTDTFTSMAGCDSIVTVNLQVLPLSYGPFDFSLCQGDSVVVGSSVYKNTGTYNDTFTSFNGCDSIVITTIQVLNHSQVINSQTLCTGESVTVLSSTYVISGTYYDTTVSANGCDSIIQTNLVVLPVSSTVIDTAICSNESITVGTSSYTAAGTYYDTLTSTNGCDSTVQTNLVVSMVPSTTIDTSICFGETYTMGSSSYTSSGTYTDTFTSMVGCDSIVTVNLQVLPLSYGPFDYSICQGDSVVVGSSVYKHAGTYNDTFTSSNGCDSIVISTIQVLNHSQVVNTRTICSGESVTVLSSTYAISGTYYDTTIAANGCDSVIQTNLVVLPVSSTVIDTAICSNESITVGTSSYAVAGTYYDTLPSANGCDSTIQTSLVVLPVPATTIDMSICFGETYTMGSSNYTSSGTYTDTFTSMAGCDSIVTVNLQVLPLSYGPFNYNICQGDSVKVGSSVYQNTGTYNDTFTSFNGCDSIVISSILVLSSYQIVRNLTVCLGENVVVGSSSYSSSGVFADTLIASNGCDSIIQTNLLVLPVSLILIDRAICDGENVIVGNSSYSTTGTYSDTLISSNGCDSVIQTNLQVLSGPFSTMDTSICFGEVYSFGSSTYGSAGTYSDTFQSANGCDSIATLNLQVLPQKYGPFNYSICQGDSIAVGNSIYKDSGTYNNTLTSSNGCDSIIISSVLVLNNPLTMINTTICSGDSVYAGGSLKGASGVYFDTLIAGNGCDSIVQTNLLVLSPVFSVIDTVICAGESVSIGSSNYSATGTFIDSITSSIGCDSIIALNLQVLPVFVTMIDTSICYGEIFSLGSAGYGLSGIYNDTFSALNGCDSIVIANLQVNPEVYGPFSITFCAGDSIQIGNSIRKTSGNYSDTLISALGCDSIVLSAITVLDIRRTLIDTVFCEGAIYAAGNSIYDSTGTYFDTLVSSFGCDSIIESNVQVLKKSFKTVNAEICQGQAFYSGSKAYTTTGTYQDTFKAANGCDSVVSINLKVYPSKFSTQVMSICMGDSVVMGNSVYRKSGTYLNTFKTYHGCDSIVETKLQVWPDIGGSSDRIMCQGDNLQFNLTGGINYKWTPSTGLSCLNCPNPVASPSDDIDYIIEVTDLHLCKGIDTIHVDVSKVEVSLDISANEVCEGDTVSFQETYTSDYPLQGRMWNFGDNSSSINQNPVHAYFESDVYHITLIQTNSQGCSATMDTTIMIHPRPNILLSSDTAICLGDSIQLQAFGATSYAWLPSDYLNVPNISNPVSKPALDIQYNVVGMSVYGCLDTSSVNIKVNPLPDLQISEDVAICPNGSAVIYAIGGTEYSWYPPIGLSSSYSQFVAAAPQTSTTYQLEALNQFGCKAIDSVNVTVYPKTEFKVSPNGEICRGDNVELSAKGGLVYRWTPPDGLSCDECASTNASPFVTTKYDVFATDTFGCKYQDSVAVYVKKFPEVRTIPDITICKGEVVILETDTSSVDNFQWYPKLNLKNSDNINPSASPDASITYVVSVTNEIGCTDKDSVRINVLNKVAASLRGGDACPGDKVSLEAVVNNASENGYEILWSPAGLFDDLHSPIQTITPAHDIEISVIVSSQMCESDTATYLIHVHDLPKVDAGISKVVYLGEAVSLTAYSYSPINSYSWSPADWLGCSNCQSASWSADRSRTFTVRVVDENGCAAIDSVAFRMVGNCSDDVFVPNAFSPNGDEVNDRLLVRSQNQIKLEYFRIFDRWGKEVYSSSDIEDGWDGQYSDKKVYPGVYVYHLKAGCRNGQSVFLKGNVTAIR